MTDRPGRAGSILRIVVCLAALLAAAGFVALSAWQWQRLAWKEGLIARVERQLAAAPQPLPPAADWPAMSREADEYRPVTLQGWLEPEHEIRVLASTELGRGQWVMVPLHLASGGRVWLNRGFVPEALGRRPAALPAGAPQAQVLVTGLLRFSESGQWLWQRNDPAAGRWVGREVQALSQAAGIHAAPFFIDVARDGEHAVDAAAGRPAQQATTDTAMDIPQGGLTVLRFSNNHRGYALTWLVLALGSVVAAVVVWRHQPGDRGA